MLTNPKRSHSASTFPHMQAHAHTNKPVVRRIMKVRQTLWLVKWIVRDLSIRVMQFPGGLAPKSYCGCYIILAFSICVKPYHTTPWCHTILHHDITLYYTMISHHTTSVVWRHIATTGKNERSLGTRQCCSYSYMYMHDDKRNFSNTTNHSYARQGLVVFFPG